MSRILVTGGAGFVGSHLCERLVNEGHEVTCLDNLYTGSRHNLRRLMTRSNFSFVRGDVNVPQYFDVDEVYHLACPASPVHYQRNPVRTIKTSVMGTLRMLDLCRDAEARLLIASTSEVYGDPAVHPQVEEYWGNVNPIGPRACYDEGKRCAEALAVSFARQYGVEVRIARIFNTYGPRMDINDGRVVSNFIVQALEQRPITIYGDGVQTRSFCYVSDLLEGLLRLMNSELQATPVNLGNPRELQIGELARMVIAQTHSSSPLVNEPLPVDDPTRRRPDISKAKAELGWEPKVPAEQGLALTIDYFRDKLGAWDAGPAQQVSAPSASVYV